MEENVLCRVIAGTLACIPFVERNWTPIVFVLVVFVLVACSDYSFVVSPVIALLKCVQYL